MARRALGTTAALVLLCCLCLLLPCTAADAPAGGSVAGGAPRSTAAASHALPEALSNPSAGPAPTESAPSDSSEPAHAHSDDAEKAARIDKLLLQAEYARFGIPESRPRPRLTVHSFPSYASLAHSLAADRQADLPRAEALLKEAAKLGSAAALNELGELALYRTSSAGRPNVTLARQLWEEAAAQGNPEAQHHLAILQWLGLTPSGRSDEGAAMLNEYFSALGDNPLAKMSLGYRHAQGQSAPQSCDAAVAYYAQVAEEVVSQSMHAPIALVVEKARLADERARSVAPEEDEDVIHYLKHSAESGDVAAQAALGHLHYYGARGFEQNPERSALYFKAAAKQGDASAMSSLGQMYMQGVGVEQNNETAFKYLSEAAAKQNAAAQNGLGYLYMHGQGTKQDYATALSWFKKAAEQGHAEAYFHLGAMYFAGLGVDKKYATALQYFGLAGQQGFTRALYNLAQMHLHGLGTIRSCSLGMKLHKSVAERGSWATVSNEAHRHFLKGNYDLAWLLYARAAEEGYEPAQANSAWMLDQGLGLAALEESGQEWEEEKITEADRMAITKASGAAVAAAGSSSALASAPPPSTTPPSVPTFRRYLLAHRHWLMAAAQGNVDALRMLGDYAFAGVLDGKPDYATAVKYYQQASDQRNAQAMFNLGYMYEHGFGLSAPDFHLAKRFYDNCLEADTDALVPVKLALAKLYAKAYWEEWFGESNSSSDSGGTSAATPASSASSSSSTPASPRPSASSSRSPSPAQPLPGPLAWAHAQLRATGLLDWWGRVRDSSNMTELFLTIEDVLLAILCAALAVIVYWRSQR